MQNVSAESQTGTWIYLTLFLSEFSLDFLEIPTSDLDFMKIRLLRESYHFNYKYINIFLNRFTIGKNTFR